jgi:hypothetical protein
VPDAQLLPSCQAKRIAPFAEKLVGEIPAPVPHRPVAFTISWALRGQFERGRRLPGPLPRIARPLCLRGRYDVREIGIPAGGADMAACDSGLAVAGRSPFLITALILGAIWLMGDSSITYKGADGPTADEEGYSVYEPEPYLLVSNQKSGEWKYSIVWLPSMKKRYLVDTKPGFGKDTFDFKFNEGWRLDSLKQTGDNTELLKQVAALSKTAPGTNFAPNVIPPTFGPEETGLAPVIAPDKAAFNKYVETWSEVCKQWLDKNEEARKPVLYRIHLDPLWLEEVPMKKPGESG